MPNKLYTKIIQGTSESDLNNLISNWLIYGQVIKRKYINHNNWTAFIFYYSPFVNNEIIIMFDNLIGVYKWMGSILVGNNIYGIPFNSTNILKLNTLTDTTTQIVCQIGNYKWSSGALSSINNMIYCPPFNTTNILKIDPSLDTFSNFGLFIAGGEKWSDTIEANGNIYCIPYNDDNIMKINPSAGDTISNIFTVAGNAKYGCGILAPSGSVYLIPQLYTKVGKLDPTTDTYSEFGALAGDFKWYRAVLYGNFIYAMPYNDHRILKIDTTSDTITYINTGISSGNENYGGCVLSNGIIYGIPYNAINILRLDPLSDTVSFFTNGLFSNNFKYYSGVNNAANNIYAIPQDGETRILKITNTG
jgi:hypothetical protein